MGGRRWRTVGGGTKCRATLQVLCWWWFLSDSHEALEQPCGHTGLHWGWSHNQEAVSGSVTAPSCPEDLCNSEDGLALSLWAGIWCLVLHAMETPCEQQLLEYPGTPL